MAECKIIKCTCASDFQDKLYGKGMRCYNPCGKGKDQGDYYKCTVCGTTTSKSIKAKK